MVSILSLDIWETKELTQKISYFQSCLKESMSITQKKFQADPWGIMIVKGKSVSDRCSCSVKTEGLYIQIRDDLHWKVSHMLHSLKGVARSYFVLWAGNTLWPLLNIFLIIFEFVCFSRSVLHLIVNWSILGTSD